MLCGWMNSCSKSRMYACKQIPFPSLAASTHLFPLCEASITGPNGGPILSNAYYSGWMEHLLTTPDHASAWHRKSGQPFRRWRGLLITHAHSQRDMQTNWLALERAQTHSPPVYSFMTHSMSDTNRGQGVIAKSKIKREGRVISPSNFLFMHEWPSGEAPTLLPVLSL